MSQLSISTYAWPGLLVPNLSTEHLWFVIPRPGPMCPFEISNTKRGSVRKSYISLIAMAPQAPLTDQSSVESNNALASRQSSTEDQSEDGSVSSERNLDDRLHDILLTLNSLTEELSLISWSRHTDNLTQVTIEGGASARRVETTRDSLHRNNNPGEGERRGKAKSHLVLVAIVTIQRKLSLQASRSSDWLAPRLDSMLEGRFSTLPGNFSYKFQSQD